MSDDCIFCTRRNQPPILFETPSFYAMPDKFAFLPGHTLIISKEHRSCFGDTPLRLLNELDEAATRVSAFLDATYGGPTWVMENGISGQTVFHAHLHLVPGSGELAFSPESHPGVFRVDGWEDLRAYFEEHRAYRYFELRGAKYIVAAEAEAIGTLRKAVADVTGLVWDGRQWLKTTTEADIIALVERWRAWTDGEMLTQPECSSITAAPTPLVGES